MITARAAFIEARAKEETRHAQRAHLLQTYAEVEERDWLDDRPRFTRLRIWLARRLLADFTRGVIERARARHLIDQNAADEMTAISARWLRGANK
jgi:hypothetical protein